MGGEASSCEFAKRTRELVEEGEYFWRSEFVKGTRTVRRYGTDSMQRVVEGANPYGIDRNFPLTHNSISDNSTRTGGVGIADDSSPPTAFSPSGSGFTGAVPALFIISVNVAPGFW